MHLANFSPFPEKLARMPPAYPPLRHLLQSVVGNELERGGLALMSGKSSIVCSRL